MQGKRKLARLFGVLVILVVLFLWMKNGLFSQREAETPLTVAFSTSDQASVLPPRDVSDGIWVGATVLPLVTAFVASEDPLPQKTTLPTSEKSVEAIAPQLPTLPLVTEFYDAYELVLPKQTEKNDEKKEEKPALVTGFTGTLPLALPVASPSICEDEMRAVYVASAYNLDFPSRPGLSKKSLEKELDAILARALSCGMNTIIFQVRPASDALYDSDIFPVSRYLAVSEGGAMALDALGYLIEKAHERGIAVHAWINPFRVRSASESDALLSAHNPAKKNPALTFTVEGAVYYNPALQEVQDLITCGVREVLRRYDVDGILFDDYFYPEHMGNEDARAYASYQAAGGRLSLADFRRENINILINRVYRVVKEERATCLFGVAPRGVWRNAEDDPAGSDTRGGAAYDEIFCDALAWVRGGYVDYLAPQIYWSFDHTAAPFAILADWWNEALAKSGVKFCASLAAYSLSDEEIERQKAYLEKLSEYGGFAIYRYAYLE